MDKPLAGQFLEPYFENIPCQFSSDIMSLPIDTKVPVEVL
jgi:hypothetical protein